MESRDVLKKQLVEKIKRREQVKDTYGNSAKAEKDALDKDIAQIHREIAELNVPIENAKRETRLKEGKRKIVLERRAHKKRSA